MSAEQQSIDTITEFSLLVEGGDPEGQKEFAKGWAPDLTEILDPIVTTTDPAEAWYTTDTEHPWNENPPTGFVMGPRPKTHP